MMSAVLEVIELENLKIFVLWVLIPLLMVVYGILREKYFCTAHLVYLVLSTFVIGYYYGGFFFLAYFMVLVWFSLWWSHRFNEFRKRNGGTYQDYVKYYSDYFGDDLNNDGIKDAFENLEIAHDPRFFWIFGSNKAKKERAEQLRGDEYSFENLYRRRSWNRNDRGYGTGYAGSKRSGTEGEAYHYERKSQSSYRKTYNGTESTYQSDGYQRKDDSYEYSDYQRRTDSYKSQAHMSEAEKKVAKQHEFARRYNLRYFAMCSTKDEAKKLYRKYATKFHPDNAITGDKDKFVAVDEEYNRFCKIPEIE